MNNSPKTQGTKQLILLKELSFLQKELEAVRQEKATLYEKLERKSEELEYQQIGLKYQQERFVIEHSELCRIKNSKSWRWSLPLRLPNKIYCSITKQFFTHLKKLWIEMGSPCPKFTRYIRHRIFGKIWPSKTEVPV